MDERLSVAYRGFLFIPSNGIGASSSPVSLTPQQFAAAFPFYLSVDSNLRILSAGKSLRQICPDAAPGAHLGECFACLRPEGPLDRAHLLKNLLHFFLLEHQKQPLKLRGQFIHHPELDTLTFLGSPWLTSVDEVDQLGLNFHDFAVHDPVVDMLLAFQSARIAMADAGKLAEKLHLQREQLQKANAVLEQQAAENARLAYITARTDNSVVLTDALKRTVWVNDGFTRLTGYSLEEMLGKSPGLLLQGPDTDSGTVQQIRDHIHRGVDYHGDILNYAKDGRIYWIHFEIQAMRNAQGEITHFMSIGTDITKRREMDRYLRDARQNAEEATAAKNEFLATISHELRTPLTSIRGFLQTILADPQMPVPLRQEFLGVIHGQSIRISRLVDSLLTLSSLESGRTQFHDELLDLGQIAQNSLREISPMAADKSHRIEATLPLIAVPFLGDPIQLQSIFSNLLTNAVKFTPDGGIINLGLSVHNHEVWITVEDNGPGIPPAHRHKVFERFHRIYRQGISQEGTGLGLPIVQAIVAHYGGRIQLKSHENQGCCFQIFLPVTAGVPGIPAEEGLENPSPAHPFGD